MSEEKKKSRPMYHAVVANFGDGEEKVSTTSLVSAPSRRELSAKLLGMCSDEDESAEVLYIFRGHHLHFRKRNRIEF